MAPGILLYRAALFLFGLLVAWLLYRLMCRLGRRVLPHRPRTLRTIAATLVLFLPPGLALGAWVFVASEPIVTILRPAPEHFSLGILGEHPSRRSRSTLLLRLLYDHPNRITHLDIAVAVPQALKASELPRSFWRFEYRSDPEHCLDRHSYRRLPLFASSNPPLPFASIARNDAGCLSARRIRDPDAFSPTLYASASGWKMQRLFSLPPLLNVERGSMPLLLKRGENGAVPHPLLQIQTLRIHWGFWSPEPIFTIERFADHRRALERWMDRHVTRP